MGLQEYILSWRERQRLRFKVWRQGDEELYTEIGNGICEGMSLDWLRRKFADKRNFVSSEKYGGQPQQKAAQAKLGQKQKTIHKQFSALRDRTERSKLVLDLDRAEVKHVRPEGWFDPVQRFSSEYNAAQNAGVLRKVGRFFGVVSTSGFENMHMEPRSSYRIPTVVTVGRCAIHRAVVEAIDGCLAMHTIQARRSGFMLSFVAGGKGHTTVFYYNPMESPWSFQWFDPNIAEFHLMSHLNMADFAAGLWAETYRKYDELQIEPIWCDVEDETLATLPRYEKIPDRFRGKRRT
jgi:hypothetical protein